MPFFIQILLLAVLGAVTGAFINWAIYQWAICQHRPISPYMKPRPDLVGPENAEQLGRLKPRRGLDFVPILGWFRLRRDGEVLGKWAWFRPLLIEISWTIGLPIFFWWQHQGGLAGTNPSTVLPAGAPAFTSLATTWFWLHAILIALMFIATFIDFDEQMIPDQVTVPGTIIALAAAAFWPFSRLPITTPGVFGLQFIDFSSPEPMTGWHLGIGGLATCIAIYAIWIWGLLPKIIPPREFRLGIAGSIRVMFASIVRSPRKNSCSIRVKKRQMYGMTKCYFLLLIAGLVFLLSIWSFLGPPQKDSLVSAFIGLGIAGGLIWGIRIVGGLALGQQAMGFGDVTLMCMIGAFLGWQASIAGFVFSIMFALVLAIILFVITKKGYLAFGPYLCMGALLAMVRWPSIWVGFEPIFWMGPWLLIAFGGSLVLMGILLPLIRWLKESMLGVE